MHLTGRLHRINGAVLQIVCEIEDFDLVEILFLAGVFHVLYPLDIKLLPACVGIAKQRKSVTRYGVMNFSPHIVLAATIGVALILSVGR